MEKWCDWNTEEWVHVFIHDLGPIPTTWYFNAELHQSTHHWETLKDEFVGTFWLRGGTKVLDKALQDIDTFIFDESHPYVALGVPTRETQMQDIANCHNITIEECDEDPRNISILELEGERAVVGPPLQTVDVTKPLKL